MRKGEANAFRWGDIDWNRGLFGGENLEVPEIYHFHTKMEFEFAPGKSESNREKHGIDFGGAQELWGDPNHIVVPARSITEDRYALIGRWKGKIWACIFTLRNENLRIISARRARKDEEAGYYIG